MFFAVCDFAALYWAALCAARVEVSAAVSSSGGGIWGMSDPARHAVHPAPEPHPAGSLTPHVSVGDVLGSACCAPGNNVRNPPGRERQFLPGRNSENLFRFWRGARKC